MKIIDCVQGTPEWHAARCGRVTASRVCDIVRETKSGVSKMRETYMGQLIAERLSGQVADTFQSDAMRHGQEQEDAARTMYAFMRDVEPVAVGFVLHPTLDMAGASPDRLISDDGLIEIKCPNSATHIATLLGKPIDPDYIKQMQWQMACTGRSWCDFVSFDPRMPGDMQLSVRRVERDNAGISSLEASVAAFLSDMERKVDELLKVVRLAA